MILKELTKTKSERVYLQALKSIMFHFVEYDLFKNLIRPIDYDLFYKKNGFSTKKPGAVAVNLMRNALYELDIETEHAGYQPIPAYMRIKIKKVYRYHFKSDLHKQITM